MKTRFGILAVAVFAALTGLAPRPEAAARTAAIMLGIEGRANATPWVAAHRSFVAVAWGASAGGKTDVFVAVSRDSGATFGNPVQVNAAAGDARLGGELPPRVALVPGSGDPEVVVLWTARAETTQIRMARSRDGGRTFAAAAALQTPGAPGDRGWPALAVDSRGTAHAIWLDHRGMANPAASGAPHDHKKAGEYDGVAMAQRSGLHYARTGASPSADRALAAGVCYCCKTALAVAPDGAIYAAWRHVYPGNIRDIAMTVSRDAGGSFAPPVRISEDKWQLNGCPDDGPAMAVDAAGTIHVVWPTVIGGDKPEGALFYATTRDGRRFTPRVRVPALGSPKPSHPQIVVDGSQVTVAWDEVINGTRVAALRQFPAGALKIDDTKPVMLAGDESSMYPALAVTASGLLAVWTSGSAGQSKIAVRRVDEDPSGSGARLRPVPWRR